jgi:DNA-binding LytR/AlgR family response regulator
MPTALIADDEPQLVRALAAELAALWPELTIVHRARHGLEAAERIAALSPDVAFLDIQMPGLTGLEVAQGIEGATRVVFVTAYDEHAVDAFEREAIDYVLKPVSRERLARTVQRVQKALAAGAPAAGALAVGAPDSGAAATTGEAAALAHDDQRLLAALQRLLPTAAAPVPGAERLRWVRASSGELTHQVAVADVLFFRADDKYTCVQAADGGEHLIRTPIHELIVQLDPEQFVQVHRSTIVNLAHLAGTRRDEASRLFLRMKGHSAELPVSRAYVHLFKAM